MRKGRRSELGQADDVPSQLWRERGQGRLRRRRQLAIGVVLDDRQAVSTGYGDDLAASARRHRRRRRIVQRGRAAEELGPDVTARPRQRCRDDAFRVEFEPDDIQAQVRGRRPQARVGQALGADDIAWIGQAANHGHQRSLRACGHQRPFRPKPGDAVLQPGRARGAVFVDPAGILVSQQQSQAAFLLQLSEAGPHAPDQRFVLEWRRHVHRHVHRGAAGCAVGVDRRLPPDKAAPPDARVEQAAAASFVVGAGDRGEVDAQGSSQPPLRRPPAARTQAPAAQIVGNRIGDGAVERLVRTADPGIQSSAEPIPPAITPTVWLARQRRRRGPPPRPACLAGSRRTGSRPRG